MKYSKYIKFFDSNSEKSSERYSNRMYFLDLIGDDGCGCLFVFFIFFLIVLTFLSPYFYIICRYECWDEILRNKFYGYGYNDWSLFWIWVTLIGWLLVLSPVLLGVLLGALKVLLTLISYPFRYMKIRRFIKRGKCLSRKMTILSIPVWNGNIEGLNFEHDWNGCKCKQCSETRDELHDWDGCKCKQCGKIRDELHDWVHKSTKKDKVMKYQDDTYKCRRCGKVQIIESDLQ